MIHGAALISLHSQYSISYYECKHLNAAPCSDCQGNLVCGNRNCGEQYGHMDCCTYAITTSSTTTTMTTTMTPTDTTMTMTTTAIKNQHPFKNSTAKEKSTLFSIKTLTALVNVVSKTLKSSFFF